MMNNTSHGFKDGVMLQGNAAIPASIHVVPASIHVIPAQAGILQPRRVNKIPIRRTTACAGMTE